MTFGVWVYYRGFPNAQSVYASIVSNSSDAIISQMHTGNGWELLIAEGDIEGKNSTTLQVKITAETDSQELSYLLRGLGFILATLAVLRIATTTSWGEKFDAMMSFRRYI